MPSRGPKSPPIHVKVCTRLADEGKLPEDAKLLLRHYHRLHEENGWNAPLRVFLDGLLPKSLNHSYVGMGRRRGLAPEVVAMRHQVSMAMTDRMRAWRPGAVIAAVVVIWSPQWLTREHCVRDLDIDNKIKPVLDAYALAAGLSDRCVWSTAAFKAVSNRTATRLWLFDLGDSVPRFELPEPVVT